MASHATPDRGRTVAHPGPGRRVLRVVKRAVRHGIPTKASRRHALVGPARLWRMKRDFQLAFLRGAGLTPDNHLLDIGCGTLRGGIPLIEFLQTGNYCGVEVRADVLEEGKAELHEHGLEHKEPTLIAAPNLGDLELGYSFDVVWAFSVLIHMSDDRLEDCMRLVDRHLAGGSFYANVNLGDRPEESWQGFPVVSRSLAFYEEVARRHGLAIADMGSLGSLGHVSGTGQDEQHMLQFRRTS